MALQFISALSTVTTLGEDHVLTYPSGIQGGDFLLAMLTVGGAPPALPITNGWVSLGIVSGVARPATYKLADGTETGTFAVGYSGGGDRGTAGFVAVFRAMDGVKLDTAGAAEECDSTITTTSTAIVPGNDGWALFGVISSADYATPYTAGSGETIDFQETPATGVRFFLSHEDCTDGVSSQGSAIATSQSHNGYQVYLTIYESLVTGSGLFSGELF